MLTSISNEGTWAGLDLKTISEICAEVTIPVIAHGGVGTLDHIIDVINNTSASAVALGSMVVYQKKGYGVLINFPEKEQLETISVKENDKEIESS